MKKIFKMLLTTCLLLLAVCGASLSVSARTYYYKGIWISSFASKTLSGNDGSMEINPL